MSVSQSSKPIVTSKPKYSIQAMPWCRPVHLHLHLHAHAHIAPKNEDVTADEDEDEDRETDPRAGFAPLPVGARPSFSLFYCRSIPRRRGVRHANVMHAVEAKGSGSAAWPALASAYPMPFSLVMTMMEKQRPNMWKRGWWWWMWERKKGTRKGSSRTCVRGGTCSQCEEPHGPLEGSAPDASVLTRVGGEKSSAHGVVLTTAMARPAHRSAPVGIHDDLHARTRRRQRCGTSPAGPGHLFPRLHLRP